MTTQTLTPAQITVSITLPAPRWLARYVAMHQTYRTHKLLQSLTPEQQRDIGQYTPAQVSLPVQLW